MISLKHFKMPVIELVLLTGLLLLVLALDMRYAVSMLWQFNLIAIFFIILITLPRFLLTRNRQPLWLALTFVALLFSLRFVDLTPRKPFLCFYYNISIGMPVDQVQTLFSQYFPARGKFSQPVWNFGNGSPVTPYNNEPKLTGIPDQSLHYVLDPNDGRFNSEWLVVYFEDGHVVGTEYLPD